MSGNDIIRVRNRRLPTGVQAMAVQVGRKRGEICIYVDADLSLQQRAEAARQALRAANRLPEGP